MRAIDIILSILMFIAGLKLVQIESGLHLVWLMGVVVMTLGVALFIYAVSHPYYKDQDEDNL